MLNIILVLVGVGLGCASTSHPLQYGLCSHLYQMYQLCDDANSSQIRAHEGKIGKAGPRGPPGMINYTMVDEMMTGKFLDLQSVINVRIDRQDKIINQTIEKENNFAELLQLAKDLRPLTLSHCGKVTKDDANIWMETGGVFDIYPDFTNLEIYCDLTTDGGGWNVFQRRMNGSVNFYRTSNDYSTGFGNTGAEFWLGLDHLHRMTRRGNYELRIDMEDWDGNKRYAKYSNFKIGSSETNYQLEVGGFSGDAGDSFSGHNGMGFSAWDKDVDIYSGGNCAKMYKGGWWYTNCHSSNLNGLYFKGGIHKSFADGIEWNDWKGSYYSLKFTEMKFRLK